MMDHDGEIATETVPEETGPVSESDEGSELTDGDGPKRRRSRPVEEACPELPLASRVEALLMSTDRPLPSARVAALLGIEPKGAARRVDEVIETLNEEYDRSQRSFRAEKVAGGWQLLTRAEYGPLMTRFQRERHHGRLSQAALETLSIVAYRQPIMRAEIEAIRGVACGEVLRGLLERRLVKIAGRAEELGRPMLYGTTREFLNVFGLANLDDLPAVEGLPEPRAARPEPDPDPEPTAAASEPGGPEPPTEDTTEDQQP
ncbi:MAG: SMC-Scp complex subunit ScpB [Planctomycetota bacterium]|jgi:segregation and condensation protein B